MKMSVRVGLLSSICFLALADAPVVDISQQPEAAPTGTNLAANGAPVVNTPVPSADQGVTTVVNPGDSAPQQAAPAQTPPAASTSDASPAAQANAPVPSIDTSSMPLNDRVQRLEQQMNNVVSMNLPQQVSELQQQIAQLRGQLQVQSHDLELLNQQQRTFYQDLDGRINQLNNINSNGAGSNTSGSNTSTKPDILNSSQASIQLKENSAFQGAIDLLGKKQYDKAANQLQSYLNVYPNGRYVSNAHYWLGDIYYMQKNNDGAESQFNTLIKTDPKSSKVPDAKLKLAIIHANQGKTAQAKRELLAIKKDHPDSTAAQLATIRLQQLSMQN